MEKRVFTDVTIPAYFQASNKPFRVSPHKNLSGHVEFRVEGTDIDSALEELFGNASIGVLDFIKALKSLRSSIFALKGGHR